MRAVPTPRVDLPAALLADLRAEAQRALPRECCGLLEGVRAEDAFTIHALHPACNLSQDADCFEIDPRDHFATVRKVRGKGAAIIGCYHSHPNGEARPSMRDLAGAGEEGQLWLILAGDKVNAFVYVDGAFVGAECAASRA